MTCEVIHEYRRPTGEVVIFTYYPGRVLAVSIDNDTAKEMFVNQRAGESIRACALRLAREWQASDGLHA